MVRKCLLLVALLIVSSNFMEIYSQERKDEVTLVTFGEAPSKDEAVKNALRSAIEQAFGTFVSANTTVINDQLVRDEIISVTNGNIKSYEELSSEQNANGKYNVTVRATVSIGKLQTYAQNHGMSAELAGGTFAYNMKLRRLNAQNEKKIIYDVQNNQMYEIFKHGLFDFSVDVTEPKSVGNGYYGVFATVSMKANKNTIAFWDTFHKTMKAISLTKEECAEYDKDNIPYYASDGFSSLDIDVKKYSDTFINYIEMRIDAKHKTEEQIKTQAAFKNCMKPYYFRNKDNFFNFEPFLAMSSRAFVIKDNLGNVGEVYKVAYEDYLAASDDYKKKHTFLLYKQRYKDGKVVDAVNIFSNDKKPWQWFLVKPLTQVKLIPGYPIVSHVNLTEGEVLYQCAIAMSYTEEELGQLNSIVVEPIAP